MFRWVSVLGFLVFFFASTEMLIAHHKVSTTAPPNNAATVVVKSSSDSFSKRSRVIPQKQQKYMSVDSDLLKVLRANNLQSLVESLESLGVYQVSDLSFLDHRDRRRLWLEAALHAASDGEDTTVAVSSWENLIQQVQVDPVISSPPLSVEMKPVESNPKSNQPSPDGMRRTESMPSQVKPVVSTKHVSSTGSKRPVVCNRIAVRDSRAMKKQDVETIAVFINSSPNGRRYFGENFQVLAQ